MRLMGTGIWSVAVTRSRIIDNFHNNWRMYPHVDQYIENLDKWKDKVSLLTKIVLECGLAEDFK